MARNFREAYRFLLPAHFRSGDFEKVVHSLALIKDLWLTRARQALEARFPTRTSQSALAKIGRDRGLIRGRLETQAHYAERLAHWRYPEGHKRRGNPWAALEQIWEYFSDGVASVKLWSIDVSFNQFTRSAAGVDTFDVYAWDWDHAPAPKKLSRFWIVLDYRTPGTQLATSPAFGDPALWGGEIGTDGYCLGLVGITPEQVNKLRDLFRGARPWKPAGTRAEWLIVTLTGSDPLPEGSYLYWSRNDFGTQVAVRSTAHRYISLNPARNNTYQGRLENWPDLVTLPGGSTYAGDPANFAWPVTLPSGRQYTGDPNKPWPTRGVRLLDDGDHT